MRFRVPGGLDIAMEFKSTWLMRRRRGMWVTKAESILQSKGIEIVNAKDVLRPALVEEPYIPLIEEKVIPKEKPPCYMFSNSFIPLANLEQSQLITNSLVFNFPDSFLETVKESTDEEREMIKDIVLRSHVLDSEQLKLPRDLEVHKYPGYFGPRVWGITKEKKINNLGHHMLLALERTQSKKELNHILHKATSKVTLKHHDKLMHMNHLSQLMLCTKTPLSPTLGPDEVKALQDSPMPDIYPLSPFIHAHRKTVYDDKEGYAVAGAVLAPHTVFMGCSLVPFYFKPEQFYGMTLVQAFSFAASYAKEKNKGVCGDLEKPVTLNIVHTNGHVFHIGRFQLNTLDCSSSVRNIFWHEPWTPIFDKIEFNAATPFVNKLDTRPYALLKAMY